MILPYSSGVLATAAATPSAPLAEMRSITTGSAIAVRMALLILSMIGCGVPAGASISSSSSISCM
jgi:hypothetical protein